MILPIVIGTAAALALVVARRPGTFHTERSLQIDAPPERIFPHVADFRAWADWSPYEQLDPQMKKTFSGPASGVGAGYSWSGNNKAGQGQMVITSATAPDELKIRLEFTRPFAAVNQGTFRFQPVAGGTKVTWAMDGTNNFGAKLFQLVVNMDKLVGTDFERGLASLKTLSESSPASLPPSAA
jgi:uncharacterized protein YndB with AHSA1/START domain